jgi:predicted HicB family RNase H-like nuclease
MKVLNYLELANKLFDMTYDQEEEFYENEFPAINDFVEKFYSQPFKPELVTKLFEGYTHIDNYYISPLCIDNINYQHKTYYLEFFWNSHSIGYIIKNSNIMIYVRSNSLPRTLDEFITDCQRAGIELEWKFSNNKDK